MLLNSTFTGNDLVDSWGVTAYAVDGTVIDGVRQSIDL